jgi:hypothetical protein
VTQRENERGRPLVDRRRAVRGRTPLGLAACTLAGPTSAVGQLRGLTTAKLQLGKQRSEFPPEFHRRAYRCHSRLLPAMHHDTTQHGPLPVAGGQSLMLFTPNAT